MRIQTWNRSRKTAISLASLLAFLFFVATAPIAFAQSDWPVWPPKSAVPAPAPSAPGSEAAAKEGEKTGKSTFAGIDSGTLGWTAAVIGGVVLIGVAAGGSSSSSNH